MRILFASPIGDLGGAELFLLEMLEELRSRAPEWDLHLVSGGAGPLLARAESIGVTCHLEPFPTELARWGDSSARQPTGRTYSLLRWLRLSRGALSYRRRLLSLISELSPDLIHSNGLKFHVLTGLIRRRGTKLVWFMHDYLGSRRQLRWILPRLGGSVDFIWANSDSVARDVQQFLPRAAVEVLYCGIDLDKYAPGPVDAEWLDQQCEPPAPSGRTLRIGLVATYARWKGQDIFLQAAAELSKRNLPESMLFYIVGGSVYQTSGSQFTREELSRQAAALGISDRVRFVPFQQDIARVYRSLDIVVHASRQPEPFGRTILEAMACGRAVVAVEAGGAAEIFAADKSAVGILPGDINSLARSLQSLACDPCLRASLEKRARTRAAAFSRARMGEQLHSKYLGWA